MPMPRVPRAETAPRNGRIRRCFGKSVRIHERQRVDWSGEAGSSETPKCGLGLQIAKTRCFNQNGLSFVETVVEKQIGTAPCGTFLLPSWVLLPKERLSASGKMVIDDFSETHPPITWARLLKEGTMRMGIRIDATSPSVLRDCAGTSSLGGRFDVKKRPGRGAFSRQLGLDLSRGPSC